MAETQYAMFSQPMRGKSEEEIVATRERAIDFLIKAGYVVKNTAYSDDRYNNPEIVNKPLAMLTTSLENMSKCHAAFFCKGWENYRGCVIEHMCAEQYGLKIIEEE